MRLATRVMLLLGTIGSVRAGEWTQFRGPGGSGVSDETGLPTKWNQAEGLRWKVALPGRGLSNPVIAEGRVYVTACSAYQQSRLHVLCFDLKDGKKLWERQFWATGNTVCHDKTNMAAPTPVTDGKRVFALFATGDVAALDAEGNLLWYRSLVRDYPDITNQVGMAASPVLAKDSLIVPMENAGESFVAGLDAATGRNRWKVTRTRDINWVTPFTLERGGRLEVLIQSADRLTAYDPETGKPRWKYEAKGLSTIPSPVASTGLVIVPGSELTAIRPSEDGAAPEVVWKEEKLRLASATPLCYRDRLYTINAAGVLSCNDLRDGKQHWQLRLKGPIAASPVAADGKVYVVNEDGTTQVVQLGDEPKIIATNSLGETILATPAIANGAIFLRSDQHLYCIGAK